MPQSERPKNEASDPLDGYRGRPTLGEYEALEEEVRAFREFADSDIDIECLADVLKKDNLLKELKDESSTLKRLVTHAYKVMDNATKRWQFEGDPKSVAAVNAHGDARAARLVIDWIETQIEIGNQSERQLEAEDYG